MLLVSESVSSVQIKRAIPDAAAGHLHAHTWVSKGKILARDQYF
jgi:hypothetical protein